MTLNDMQLRLTEELQRASADVPARERLVEILNSAKDRLANEMEIIDSDIFMSRQTFTVAADASTMVLPVDFLRVVGLTRTDTAQPVDIEVIDHRERYLRLPTAWTDFIPENPNHLAPAVYLEGGSLYFVNASHPGMNVLLRYHSRVPDLTISDGASTYTGIPPQWHYLLVDLAAEHAVPASSSEYKKIVSRIAQGLSRLAAALSQRADSQQHFVRMIW